MRGQGNQNNAGLGNANAELNLSNKENKHSNNSVLYVTRKYHRGIKFANGTSVELKFNEWQNFNLLKIGFQKKIQQCNSEEILSLCLQRLDELIKTGKDEYQKWREDSEIDVVAHKILGGGIHSDFDLHDKTIWNSLFLSDKTIVELDEVQSARYRSLFDKEKADLLKSNKVGVLNFLSTKHEYNLKESFLFKKEGSENHFLRLDNGQEVELDIKRDASCFKKLPKEFKRKLKEHGNEDIVRGCVRYVKCAKSAIAKSCYEEWDYNTELDLENLTVTHKGKCYSVDLQVQHKGSAGSFPEFMRAAPKSGKTKSKKGGLLEEIDGYKKRANDSSLLQLNDGTIVEISAKLSFAYAKLDKDFAAKLKGTNQNFVIFCLKKVDRFFREKKEEIFRSWNGDTEIDVENFKICGNGQYEDVDLRKSKKIYWPREIDGGDQKRANDEVLFSFNDGAVIKVLKGLVPYYKELDPGFAANLKDTNRDFVICCLKTVKQLSEEKREEIFRSWNSETEIDVEAFKIYGNEQSQNIDLKASYSTSQNVKSSEPQKHSKFYSAQWEIINQTRQFVLTLKNNEKLILSTKKRAAYGALSEGFQRKLVDETDAKFANLCIQKVRSCFERGHYSYKLWSEASTIDGNIICGHGRHIDFDVTKSLTAQKIEHYPRGSFYRKKVSNEEVEDQGEFIPDNQEMDLHISDQGNVENHDSPANISNSNMSDEEAVNDHVMRDDYDFANNEYYPDDDGEIVTDGVVQDVEKEGEFVSDNQEMDLHISDQENIENHGDSGFANNEYYPDQEASPGTLEEDATLMSMFLLSDGKFCFADGTQVKLASYLTRDARILFEALNYGFLTKIQQSNSVEILCLCGQRIVELKKTGKRYYEQWGIWSNIVDNKILGNGIHPDFDLQDETILDSLFLSNGEIFNLDKTQREKYSKLKTYAREQLLQGTVDEVRNLLTTKGRRQLAENFLEKSADGSKYFFHFANGNLIEINSSNQLASLKKLPVSFKRKLRDEGNEEMLFCCIYYVLHCDKSMIHNKPYKSWDGESEINLINMTVTHNNECVDLRREGKSNGGLKLPKALADKVGKEERMALNTLLSFPQLTQRNKPEPLLKEIEGYEKINKGALLLQLNDGVIVEINKNLIASYRRLDRGFAAKLKDTNEDFVKNCLNQVKWQYDTGGNKGEEIFRSWNSETEIDVEGFKIGGNESYPDVYLEQIKRSSGVGDTREQVKRRKTNHADEIEQDGNAMSDVIEGGWPRSFTENLGNITFTQGRYFGYI